MSYSIRLDRTDATWWIDDNVITLVSNGGDTTARYALPRGKPRVTLTRLGGGRSQLALGGYTTTLVSVTGPEDDIGKLRESVI